MLAPPEYPPENDTPIFQTVSGQSACPRENNTFSADAVDLSFGGGFTNLVLALGPNDDEVSVPLYLKSLAQWQYAKYILRKVGPCLRCFY